MRVQELILEVMRIHGKITKDPKRKFHQVPEEDPDFNPSQYREIARIGPTRLLMFNQMPGYDRDFYLVDADDNVLYKISGVLKTMKNGGNSLWINAVTRAEDTASPVRAVDIYRAIVLDLKWILVSDSIQTAQGAKLWDQLVASPGIGHHVMFKKDSGWQHRPIDARKHFMHDKGVSRIVAYPL